MAQDGLTPLMAEGPGSMPKDHPPQTDPDTDVTMDQLRPQLAAFVRERDWTQFHTPKNLAASVAIEAGELLEQFQWVDPSPAEVQADAAWRERVADELADVALLTLMLAERLGIRLEDAMAHKMRKNEARYPAGEFRGSARKAQQ